MKRTIIALATVITATLIYQHSEKSVASNPIPPSLIGVWKGNDTLRLYPDGSYYVVLITRESTGGRYNECSTGVSRTTIGSFTINENKITFHIKTLSVKDFMGCAGWTRFAPFPKKYSYQNRYIVDSFSLQNNGQTLVLKQSGGNLNTSTQVSYRKSRS